MRSALFSQQILIEITLRDRYLSRLFLKQVPINFLFLQHLKAYTIIFAFGLGDKPIHSPNEFFRIASFVRGQKAYGMLLHRLSEDFKEE